MLMISNGVMTMTSSEERREVAERLRENANKHIAVLDYLGGTQMALWWLLLHTIGCNSNEQEVAFNMLADLIDPTCYVESVDSTGRLLAYRLSCGDTAYVAHPALRPSYCPICGARVVDEDD